MNLIEYLDGRALAIKVIITLYEALNNNETLNRTELWRRTGGGKGTISDRIDEFTRMGILTVSNTDREFPYGKGIHLTDLGVQLGQILSILKNLDSEN